MCVVDVVHAADNSTAYEGRDRNEDNDINININMCGVIGRQSKQMTLGWLHSLTPSLPHSLD